MRTALLLAALHLPAGPPQIVSDLPGPDTCEDTGDRPCPGRLLTIRNASKRPVFVGVRCRKDPRTDLDVRIPVRGKVRVLIGMDSTLRVGECVIFRMWPDDSAQFLRPPSGKR
jgi:hypothetical protein